MAEPKLIRDPVLGDRVIDRWGNMYVLEPGDDLVANVESFRDRPVSGRIPTVLRSCTLVRANGQLVELM